MLYKPASSSSGRSTIIGGMGHAAPESRPNEKVKRKELLKAIWKRWKGRGIIHARTGGGGGNPTRVRRGNSKSFYERSAGF